MRLNSREEKRISVRAVQTQCGESQLFVIPHGGQHLLQLPDVQPGLVQVDPDQPPQGPGEEAGLEGGEISSDSQTPHLTVLILHHSPE